MASIPSATSGGQPSSSSGAASSSLPALPAPTAAPIAQAAQTESGADTSHQRDKDYHPMGSMFA
eukprot:8388950-Alexandrium_andersonii.AAC.1